MFRRARRTGSTSVKKVVRLEVEELETRTVPTTVTVTNASGDPAMVGSLPYEVARSNASAGGYTIQFSSLFNTAQTINLTASMSVTKPLYLQGPGANLLTITPASGNNHVLYFQNGSSGSTVSGVTLANTTGSTSAAIFEDINPGSQLTVLRSVITGFNSTGAGAGIDMYTTNAGLRAGAGS
jgi:hypothetical protein